MSSKCLELCPLSLVPRPSHHPIFDRLQSTIERTSLRTYVAVSAPSAGVLNVHEAKNVLLLVQNENMLCKMCSFDVGSPGNEKLKDGLGPRLQTAPRVNASVLRVFILEMMYALDTV